MIAAPAAGEAVGLGRRVLSLLYEALLATALVLAMSVPFAVLTQGWDSALKRPLNQLYLALALGIYFVWQWTRGGQTLAMKTWRLRLVTRDGGPLSAGRAARRYAFALAGTALAGFGFIWALFDPERQFLHDRLAGTKIIVVPAARSSPPQR